MRWQITRTKDTVQSFLEPRVRSVEKTIVFFAQFELFIYFCRSKYQNDNNMIDVKQTLSDAGEEMDMACMYLDESFSHIRAGRANAAILDGIRVENYGMKVPLNQVASVTTPDARTIAIKPWEKKMIHEIEKAIINSNVGITPDNNGEVIRLAIPVPTEERRRELSKQCNQIAEKVKVQIRKVRGDVKDLLKKAIKDGLSEDLEKDAEADLQKVHDKYIARVDELLAEKTKEIMTV